MDDIKQSLELLPDDIGKIPLTDLVDKIHKETPSAVSGGKSVRVYMAWLHSRLSVIDNSDEEIFNNEVDSWCRFLQYIGSDNEAIEKGFKEWQSYQSVADPSSSRRLNFAGMRVSHFLNPPSASEGEVLETPGNPPPSRAMLAFNDPDPDDLEPSLDEDGSLSFLTGANAMVNDTAFDHDRPMPFSSPVAPVPVIAVPEKQKKARAKAPMSYICNRCGGKGTSGPYKARSYAYGD